MSGNDDPREGLAALLADALSEDTPDPVLLVRYADDPDSVSPQERRLIEESLAESPRLRDQLEVLRRLEPELGFETPAGAESSLSRLLASLRDSFARLGQPRLSPALVAAGLVLLAIPVAVAIWSVMGPRRPVPSGDAGSAPERIASGEPAFQGGLPESAPVAEPAEGPELEPPGKPEPPARIVVAALVPPSPLVYAAPRDLGDAGLGRFDPATRSAGGAPAPRALAPDHLGLTVQGSPKLHWFLPVKAVHRIEFALVAPDEVDPIVLLSVNAPVESGFHRVPLADHGVTLEPGVVYRWSVALVLDEDARHRDVIGGAAIKRIPPSPSLQAELIEAGAGAAGHVYAANGLWYDALDFISERIRERPELRARRAELLEQAGMKAPADYDRRTGVAE